MQTVSLVAITLLSVIFIIGVPGNIITLFVYLQKARKSSTFVFISFMAISDFLLCCSLPLQIVFVFQLDEGVPNLYICKSICFVITACILLSVVSGAAVGFDRYVALCRPLRRRLSVNTSVVLSVICSVMVIFAALPSFMVITVTNYGNFSLCRSLTSSESVLIYIRKYAIVGTFVVAALITIVSYVLVWRAIHGHKRVGTKSKIPSSLENNSTFQRNHSVEFYSHFITNVPMKNCNDRSNSQHGGLGSIDTNQKSLAHSLDEIEPSGQTMPRSHRTDLIKGATTDINLKETSDEIDMDQKSDECLVLGVPGN
ncbi:putative G-protein coupled receptor 34 [Holothuria leucospilota]|uniref:G-protein coupled receptor 34 n=1 Tax=Holothuria leucospilota TaxID=206669 RepID=A0A9Q1BR91_HOLLE|nr:putative G-protein coupled receptor 34 [Holothuria leucospilota]